MPNNSGHILSDDVVVNYKNRDRDNCLHFLTHIDTSCHDLASFISPTAKRIYTSIFNAWFLKINFNVKHIDVQGFDTNKSYKITYKGNKYIYSFIDSKFTTGSVALLLHGAFGTYLYTGNFCYHPSFVRSPVLLPVIEAKALTRLYLDNTYYEQPSNFFGFDEIVSQVVELIKSEPMKNVYIYAEKITMDPLLAEIASKLEEKVYACQSTMEIMKILGYESFFTRHSNESRIFIDKALNKKRDFERDNIGVYLNRYSESCKIFKKIEKKGNLYNFNFYCHSNHKEICELLRILKPESMTFLFSEIDNAKVSYDFKFKYDFPRNVLFKGNSTKPPINVEGVSNKVIKKIPGQLNKPTIINDNNADARKELGKKTIIISKNQDLLNLNTNDGAKNVAHSSASGNQDGTHFHNTEYRCPLRIRKVPEINNVGLSKKTNCTKEDGPIKCVKNLTFRNGIIYNNPNEINNSDKNASLSNVQAHSSIETFHNYHKPKPKQPLKFIKLQDNNLAGNTLIPSNIKSLSSCIVPTKTGMPLVFNPRLVKENGLNRTNPKIIQISNIGMVSDGKKNTILVKRKYVDVKKPCVITVPPDDTQNTKVNYVENENHFITKEPIMLPKSKTCDTNLNIKQPPAVNLTKVYYGSRDNNSVSVPNNSFQIPENSLDEPEESISSESEICDRDSVQSEASRNCTIDEDRYSDSLIDSINLQLDHDDKPSETLAGFHLRDNQPNLNERNCGDNSTVTKLEKSVVNNKAIDASHCKLPNDSELEPLINKSTEKDHENEFCENNCQQATKDNSNKISKRCLSDDENGQSRKKLRSDNISQCLLQSNCQQKKPVSLIKHCSVVVRRNGFERSYFYSSQHDCYLPKFCGFKKHEVRPRTMLITLRNLQKQLKNYV